MKILLVAIGMAWFSISAFALDAPTGCQVRFFKNVSNISDPRDIFADPDAKYEELITRWFSKTNGQDIEKSQITLDIDSRFDVVVWDNRKSSNNPDTIAFAPKFKTGPVLRVGFVSILGWFEGREAFLFSDGTLDHVVDIYCWRAQGK